MARDHRLVIEVVGDTRKAQKALRNLSLEVRGFRRGLAQGLGFGAATVGVAGFALGVRDAVQSFGDFQQSLQKMVGLSGVAQKSIKGLGRDVQQLAPIVGKGPQELADALFFITSSGIDAAHAMDVLTVSAKASAAGLGETQVVADAVTSAMNAYGPSIVSATKATDVLVATVREGKGEADQFAGVIGNVAAIAAELGVSFNEVGAALAAQTRLGTDAEAAATQLSQVFNAFLNTSPKVAKAFEGVGLNLDDLRRTLRERGLLAALTTIKGAFGSSTVELRKAIPEIRAFRGVLALVGKQSSAVRGIFERLAKSTGSLETAFNAVSKTQAQQFAKLNASLQVFKITLGAALAPAINNVLVPLNKWLSQTENQKKVQKELTDTVRSVVGGIRSLIAALKPLAQLAKNTSDQLGGLQNTLRLLATVLVVSKVLKYGTALTGLGTKAAASTTQVNALRLALLRLGALAVITVGIEVILNHKKIEDQVDNFLRSHGVGFLASKQIKIGADLDVTRLEAQRKALEKLGEGGSFLAQSLDKAIKKAKELQKQRIGQLAPLATIRDSRAEAQVANQVTKPLVDEADLKRKAILAAKKASAAAKRAFEKSLGQLDLKFSQAGLTSSLKDDLAVLKEQERVVRARLAVTGNNLELQNRLVDIQSQELSIQQQITEQVKAAARARQERIKSSQFKALGLTADGQQRVASIGAIRNRAQSLTQELKASNLDPAKIKAFVKRISVVFTKQFDNAKRDVRQAILDLFAVINDTLNSGSKEGPLTKTEGLRTKKLLAGLGLSSEEKRALRGRLAGFNTAGTHLAGAGLGPTGSFVVNTTVNLDGQKVASNTTKHQQRSKRRNPQQKRGPNRKN